MNMSLDVVGRHLERTSLLQAYPQLYPCPTPLLSSALFTLIPLYFDLHKAGVEVSEPYCSERLLLSCCHYRIRTQCVTRQIMHS